MPKKFCVIGAGMAGLFAAALLRDECVEVIEAQKSLPNNHSALLRFRSSIVGDAVNIPFQRVNVIKAVSGSLGNSVADAIAYSRKTNGRASLRSIISAQGAMEERFIAPPDFIARLRDKVTAPILFDRRWIGGNGDTPVISTMPMPLLAKMLNYSEFDPEEEFEGVSGFTISAIIQECDLCATLYFPHHQFIPYRASITGNRLIIEVALPGFDMDEVNEKVDAISGQEKFRVISEVMSAFGFDFFQCDSIEVRPQLYAKILPIDENKRKRFIMWASDNYNIYSFGRFATWRPGLLMDDLVKDIRRIHDLVNGGTSYEARM